LAETLIFLQKSLPFKNRVNRAVGYRSELRFCHADGMKNKKLNCKITIKNQTRALCRIWPLTLAMFVLTGCLSTPHTTIEGRINGSPFVVKAPKDGDLSGFELTAGTNGTVHIHIDHLAVKMNPDVISQTGTAQTAIIKATGDAVAGAVAAGIQAAVFSGAKAVAP
jgi:hypothetical protein